MRFFVNGENQGARRVPRATLQQWSAPHAQLVGKEFAVELLAIQAGVYKFSQELELTSKVVEKATSGVKQTLQTQV